MTIRSMSLPLEADKFCTVHASPLAHPVSSERVAFYACCEAQRHRTSGDLPYIPIHPPTTPENIDSLHWK